MRIQLGGRWIFWAAVALTITGLLFSSPIFLEGLPPGIDTGGHLWLSEVLMRFPSSGWDPYWYCGQPTGLGYPSLTQLFVCCVGQISSLEAAYKIVGMTFYLLGPLALLWLALELGFSKPVGFMAALFWTFSYPVVNNFAFFGRLSTVISFPFFMSTFACFERAFRQNDRKKFVLWSALGGLVFAIAVSIHLHSAYYVGILLLIYGALRLAYAQKRRMILLGAGIGISLAMVLTIPTVLPSLAETRFVDFSRESRGGWFFTLGMVFFEFLPKMALSYPSQVSVVPFALGIASLFNIFYKSITKKRWSFGNSFVVSWLLLFCWLGLGESGMLFNALPYSGLLDLSRFWLLSYAALMILAGDLVSKIAAAIAQKAGMKKALLFVSMVVLVYAVDAAPNASQFRAWQIPQDRLDLLDWLRQNTGEARVEVFGFNGWDTYLLPAYADVHLTQGWYRESAPMWRLCEKVRWETASYWNETWFYQYCVATNVKFVITGRWYGSPAPDGSKLWADISAINVERHLEKSSFFERVGEFGETKVYAVKGYEPTMASVVQGGPTQVSALRQSSSKITVNVSSATPSTQILVKEAWFPTRWTAWAGEKEVPIQRSDLGLMLLKPQIAGNYTLVLEVERRPFLSTEQPQSEGQHTGSWKTWNLHHGFLLDDGGLRLEYTADDTSAGKPILWRIGLLGERSQIIEYSAGSSYVEYSTNGRVERRNLWFDHVKEYRFNSNKMEICWMAPEYEIHQELLLQNETLFVRYAVDPKVDLDEFNLTIVRLAETWARVRVDSDANLAPGSSYHFWRPSTTHTVTVQLRDGAAELEIVNVLSPDSSCSVETGGNQALVTNHYHLGRLFPAANYEVFQEIVLAGDT